MSDSALRQIRERKPVDVDVTFLPQELVELVEAIIIAHRHNLIRTWSGDPTADPEQLSQLDVRVLIRRVVNEWKASVEKQSGEKVADLAHCSVLVEGY